LNVIFAVLMLNCKGETKKNIDNKVKSTENKELSPIAMIEKAHHKTEFLNHKAIVMDMEINFGGKERLDAEVTFLTNSTKGKLELKDSSFIYFSNDKVFHSTNLKNEKAARFDAYTWMYFLLFPTKLSDEGTVWSDVEELQLNSETFNTQKLTFKPDTGDAPDDWYVVYSDPKTHLIEYAGYIVTVNKSKAKAELDPHAIGYSDFENIDGVPIATTWTFYEWNKTDGLKAEIGDATLSNIRFISPNDETFKVPDGYIEK